MKFFATKQVQAPFCPASTPRLWLGEPELGLAREPVSCVADTYWTETGRVATISLNICTSWVMTFSHHDAGLDLKQQLVTERLHLPF